LFGPGVGCQLQQRQREQEQCRQQQLRAACAVWKMIPHYFSFKSIYKCYLKCRSNKRNKLSSLEYEWNCEEKLLALQKRLIKRTYYPSHSVYFIVKKPKVREIFSSTFEDRIVHHLIVSELEKMWDSHFIFDSYSCRRNKGTHMAVKRLQKFIRQVTTNGVIKAFYIHIDIKDFFLSIDKNILFKLLKCRVFDPVLLNLIEKVLFHDPTQNFRVTGSLKNVLFELPQNKTLFKRSSTCGLPIGNLTSQFFANVYLNPLDQFIKHKLKCRHYMRYCDDLIILGETKEELEEIREKVEEFINDELNLELNEKITRIANVNNGIDFLGYIIRKRHILVRRRTVNNLRLKLREFESVLLEKFPRGTLYYFNRNFCDKLLSTLNSYLGQFKHANTYRLTHSLFRKYSFLNQYFLLEKNKVKRRYGENKKFKNLYTQYSHFLKIYRNMLIFFQVGCFVEFYNRQALLAACYFGLCFLRPRKGFNLRCGFPLKKVEKYKSICYKHRIPFMVIIQTGYEKRSVMEREITLQFVSAP